MPHVPHTLTPYTHRYTTGRQQRGEARPATVRQEQIILRCFAATFGARPINQLAAVHIEAWLATTTALSPATRRTYYAIVRRFVRWLAEHGTIRRDPTLGIRTPKVPRSVPRALSPADVAAIWRTLPDARARCMVTLMLELGLRIGEVVTLQLGDIDHSSRTVTVIGKGGHERSMPLTARTTTALARYLADDPPRGRTGPLIRSTHDHRSPITVVYASHLVSRWMTAAGVKQRAWDGRSAHACRHTAASEIADLEPDLRVVQSFLGHRDLSTTQVYLRAVDHRKLRATMDRRGDWA